MSDGPHRWPTSFGTIRIRLTAWFLLALSVLVIAGSVTTYLVVRRQLRHQAVVAARDLARAAGATEDPAEAGLDRIAAPGDRVWLVDAGGRVVSHTTGATGRSLADVQAAIRAAQAQGESEAVTATVTLATGTRAIVLRTRTGLHDTLDTLRWTLIVVGAIGIALAAALGALLAWRVLRPVDRMREEVDRIPGDELDRRLPEGRPDELGRLALAFNRLLARAESAVHEQERFVADASHELKTPVTAVEGHARLVGRALERHDLGQARESAEIVRRESHRLAVLLRELLSLAESGTSAPAPPSAVRLDRVVAEACDEMWAAEPGRSVETDLAPATVAGDHGRLRELALVLIDNAIKYSPPGTTISVAVSDGERPALTVRDRGTGLSTDDQVRAFDRFFRGSASRGVPGSGLGLAIARSISERHGATISLGSDEEGTRAVVTFPPSANRPANCEDGGPAVKERFP